MNNVILLFLIIVLITYLVKFIKIRANRSIHLKAGKKWDGIVKELSKRR